MIHDDTYSCQTRETYNKKFFRVIIYGKLEYIMHHQQQQKRERKRMNILSITSSIRLQNQEWLQEKIYGSHVKWTTDKTSSHVVIWNNKEEENNGRKSWKCLAKHLHLISFFSYRHLIVELRWSGHSSLSSLSHMTWWLVAAVCI